jgi:hypothetical protein
VASEVCDFAAGVFVAGVFVAGAFESDVFAAGFLATRVLVALAPVNYRVSVVLWRFQPPEGMTLVSLQ